MDHIVSLGLLGLLLITICGLTDGAEYCLLKMKKPEINDFVVAGEVYTVQALCANFFCESSEFSPTGKPRLRQFSTGCRHGDRCMAQNELFYDENCYKKKCVFTEEDDGSTKAKVQFVSTNKKSCRAADNTCKPRGSKYFPCFLQDEYQSHCACIKTRSFAYLKNLLPFSAPRIGTRDGNGGGEFCYFPFKFNGRLHDECIGGADGESWCSTTPDMDKYGKYGVCIDAPSYQFTLDGYKCEFPFKYNGTLHHTCIRAGRPRPWCGTTFNVRQRGDWDYCERS